MTTLNEQTVVKVEPSSEPGHVAGTSSVFNDKVFLMVNSLETGGTERQFVQMARALEADGIPLQLGCLLKKGPFVAGLDGLIEFPLGGSLYGLQSLRARRRLQLLLRDSGVAVAHAFDFYTNLTLAPAARMAGTPVVIGSQRQIGDLLTPAQFYAQLASFWLCDRVVCNSQAAADRLLKAGLPARKVVVIGNALPPEAFGDGPPLLPRTNGALRVGVVARMNWEYKNHRGFLRAAKLVSEKISDVQFVLAGDGPLRAGLEKEAAALGLQERVQFLGDRRDVPAVLRSLDVTVVPSASESLSNVMLESMAAGVPVVATAVGGSIEIGGEGRAVMVPANDEQSLAKALLSVLQGEDARREMAQTARAFVESHYSVRRITQQYEELYAAVLAEKQKHGSLRRRSALPAADATIRVAFVAPSLRYVGGQSVQADLLIKNWKNDPDVAATFIPVDPRFPLGLRWAERVPGLRTVLREPLYLWNLWRGLKDVDIAHIFSASYTSFLLAPLPASLVAWLRGKKVLVHYHSGEAQNHLRGSRIARRMLRKIDRLVVPSGYLEKVFREFGLQAQAIPNIIDLSQFHYRVRSPLRPHLVCTRGFHPYYAVDIVVRAFAEVQQVYPDAQLDLVGGGPLEKSIRDLAAQLKLPSVNFRGVASRSEIGRCYDQADIFVNASILDNMPVSILEAFASGTPVVTTELEGVKLMVEHERTGLLSKPGDATALAQNILRLLNTPDLGVQLAQEAFEKSKLYHWTAVRKQWLRLYGDIRQKRGMTKR